MNDQNRWFVSEDEQNHYIDMLTPELAPLRAKLGISQGDIAALIGISRQTYSAIEKGRRRMSWSTYVSLVFFFDSMTATHTLLRTVSVYPSELISRLNGGALFESVSDFGAVRRQIDEVLKMFSAMDDQGFRALREVLMREYSRCSQLPGD